jgi:nucleotide-binding universal stress UspA family protein
MFEKIVVGCAEDQAGRDAVVLAAKLAALNYSDWTVVFPYQPLTNVLPADELQQRMRADVLTLTADMADLREPLYHWSPSSWPVHALREMAMYEHAQLIVLGAARARTGHLHMCLMDRIVHATPCALAVAPARYAETAPGEFQRIAVGFAPSPEGVTALHAGWWLAARSGGTLTVIAGAALAPELASYAESDPGYADAQQEIFDQTEGELRAATAELGNEVPVVCETISGQPADVLIERSAELDILVLGSRAHGALRHLVTGGVSTRVMREAHCPVLALPRGVGRESPPPLEHETAAPSLSQ